MKPKKTLSVIDLTTDPPKNGYRWCVKYKRRIPDQSCGIHRRDTKCPKCEFNMEEEKK